MGQPTWTTPAGSIGTFTEDVIINYNLVASATTIKAKTTSSVDNSISCDDCSTLVPLQPIIFTGTSFGNIISGTTYYVSTIISSTKFTISATSGGAQKILTTASGYLIVSTTNTLEFTLLNGALPSGTLSLSSVGLISGTPSQVETDTTSSFTVRLEEYYGSTLVTFSDRTFSMTITGISVPSFITPAGPLYPSGLLDSTWDPYQLLYVNSDPNTTVIARIVSGSLPPGLEMNSTGLIRGYADQLAGTYAFSVTIQSESGTATREFSIEIVTQTASTRAPSITNTNPPSFNISILNSDFPYYISSDGDIGTVIKDNNFIFKILGDDFDSGPISYTRTGTLPSGISDNIRYKTSNTIISITNGGTGYAIGDNLKVLGSLIGGVDGTNDLTFRVATLSGSSIATVNTIDGLNVDSNQNYSGLAVTTVTGIGTGAVISVAKLNAGWLSGTVAATIPVQDFTFTYTAVNTFNSLSSDPVTFSMRVLGKIDGEVFDPTIIWNTASDLGTLINGQICDLAVSATSVFGLDLAYEIISGALPSELTLSTTGDILGKVAFEQLGSLDFTFTVRAWNSLISSEKTFTLSVSPVFEEPYDNLYIRAYLNDGDRVIIDSLLSDTGIIPDEYLYRIDDPNFGKATEVRYQHLYGVPTTTLANYISSLQYNHYWRNITLGPIKTAIATDTGGNIIYEVVYSEISDNLVTSSGISISKAVTWPASINPSVGTVYPASLPNMRTQVVDVLGQMEVSQILPRWMTSQQASGDSLGYVSAWVICYTKPGYSEFVKNNIVSSITNTIVVTNSYSEYDTFLCNSTSLFYPNMRIQFTSESTLFGGVSAGVTYYVQSITSATEFTISTTFGSATPISLTTGEGTMNIEQQVWNHTLNEINFKLDRLETDKSMTFNYDPTTESWAVLPSGAVDTDIHDQFVFFPKQNILG